MTEAPNVRGPQDPRKPAETHRKRETDPDKFKKVFEVDESEETSKRDSRQLARQQEEEEEEEPITVTKPSVDFREFLKEKQRDNSIFKVGEGEDRTFSVSESDDRERAPQPVSEKEPVKEGDKTPDFALKRKEGSKKTTPAAKKEEIEEPGKKATPKKPAKKGAVESKIEQPLAKKEEAPQITPPLPLSEEEMKKQEAAAKKLELEAKEALAEKEMHKKEEEVAKTGVTVELPKEKEFIASKTTEEESLEKEKKKKEPQFLTEDEEEKRDQKGNTSTPETASFTGQTNLAAVPIDIIPPSAPTPTYSQLSSKMFDLFERMVGLMILESKKGIHTTTIRLHMQGSIFDGCEIKLEQYDTAPNSFNVQLLGNAKAIDLFNTNMGDLVSAFHQAKLPFQVNLLRPSIVEEPKHLVKRKGKAGDEEPDQGEQQ